MNVFNILTLKQIFWKTKIFQKTGVPFFNWGTKIEIATFPYKTAVSKAVFLKILLQSKSLLGRVNLVYQLSISTRFVSPGVFFEGAFFPVSLLNSKATSIQFRQYLSKVDGYLFNWEETKTKIGTSYSSWRDIVVGVQ